jgi:hypothetical protein
LPADDEELARVVADLVGRAGRAGNVTPDHVEHERLVLERARIERAILRARAEAPSSIPELARQQQQIRDAIHRVDTRLEKAV